MFSRAAPKNDERSFILLYNILSSLYFVGPTDGGSEGIVSSARQDSDHPSPSGLEKGVQGIGRWDTSKKGENANPRKRDRHGKKKERDRRTLRVEKLDRGELRVEKFYSDPFERIGYFGEGRCGQVFEGIFRGERAAVKEADLWQQPEMEVVMLTEARVYVELGKLQGHGIPKLLGVGYWGGLFELMLQFAGSPIEKDNLDDVQREMIVGVLASIHGEGYLHGDIRLGNILVEYLHDGPKITFIDFGLSRKISSDKECRSEMEALKKQIGFRSIKKRRAHHPES